MENITMKKIYRYTLACVAIAAMAACSKEVADNAIDTGKAGTEDPGTAPVEMVTITATIPSTLTKVDLSQDSDPDGVIHLKWHARDVITVKDASDPSKSATFTLKDGEEDKVTGTFSGDASALAGSTSFDISYSNLGSYAEQDQASDGDTGHLKYGVTLSGVDTYSDITFSQDWAGSNGGTCTESSVLRLRAQLPSGMAATVQAVIFKADQDIFDGGRSLKVKIDTPGDTGSDNIINVYATLPGGVVIPAGTNLLFQFQTGANDYDIYTAHRLVSSATAFQEGKVNAFKLNCPNIESYANATNTSIGTSANPYLIGDQHQMKAISLSSTKQCYQLVDSLDMTGVTWSPWNKATGYNDIVDFDGKDKSIRHLNYPLFYVLKASTVKNLTFKDATISITGRGGVLAQFIQGTGTTVTNVDVDNVSVTAQQYTGGLIGRINSGSGDVAATISGCDVNVTVSSGSENCAGGLIGCVEYPIKLTDCSVSGNVSSTGQYVGGLVGYAKAGAISKCCYLSGTVSGASYLGGLVGVKVDSGTLTIDNSYVSGNVLGTEQRAGGILGDYDDAGTCTIENCYVSGSVKCDRCVGGIVGYVRNTGLSLVRCMPYNSEIRATSTNASTDYYSSGVVVGYSSSTVIVSYCYRANIADGSWPFSEYAKYAANNTVTNHSFITSAGSIPKRIDAWDYSYYHHGRKTSASNLSALVQMGDAIGGSWSSDIWDFKGNYPTFKK